MNNLMKELYKEYKRLYKREVDLRKEKSELPEGYIQRKIIKEKDYYYRQFRVGKRIKSIYVKKNELDEVQNKINRRKEIEKELQEIKNQKTALETVGNKDDLMIMIIRDAVLKIVKDYPEIKKIVLFGSRAESRYRDDSDVDLMFESRVPISLLKQNEFRLRIEEEIGLEVDLVHGPLKDDTFLEIDKEVEVYAA